MVIFTSKTRKTAQCNMNFHNNLIAYYAYNNYYLAK